MLEDRNIKYPSWVLAGLLAVIAYIDATHALTLMQTPNASGGWFIDLLTAAICAALGTLMLMRPHLWFFTIAVGWSFLAFLSNFIMKSKDFDELATQRMTLYFIVFVGAAVLAGIEGWKWWEAEKAKRPVNPWAGQPWQGQYPGMPPQGYPQQPQQYAPPPMQAPQAPQAPAPQAPPAPPAAPQP